MSTGTSGNAGSAGNTPWLVIARAGANRGFAGGNNVGLRYLEQRTTVSHFLLLNNDATVAPDFSLRSGARSSGIRARGC